MTKCKKNSEFSQHCAVCHANETALSTIQWLGFNQIHDEYLCAFETASKAQYPKASTNHRMDLKVIPPEHRWHGCILLRAAQFNVYPYSPQVWDTIYLREVMFFKAMTKCVWIGCGKLL